MKCKILFCRVKVTGDALSKTHVCHGPVLSRLSDEELELDIYRCLPW